MAKLTPASENRYGGLLRLPGTPYIGDPLKCQMSQARQQAHCKHF